MENTALSVPTESTSPTEDSREDRAREWIRALSELPERCAGTFSEREAAERIREWMQALGLRDVALEAVPNRPRSGYVLALHTGLAALGYLWGGFAGMALAVLAAYSFRRELHHRRTLLSRVLPAPPSVNVIGRSGPASPARRVVLSAHIDAAQAGFLFSRQLADLFARGATSRKRPGGTPVGPLALPEALVMSAAVLSVFSWLGAHGALITLAGWVTLGGLAIAVASTLQWATAPASPGANDNASAVAAMLTCAETLRGQLPDDTELVVVGTGAEEVGCQGMHVLVAERGDWSPDHTYFVNFECVGGGNLHYIRSEGVLGKSGYPPQLTELARRVAASGRFGAVTPTDLLAATDGHVPAGYGYPTLSLISLEDNGVPRNYHRPEDTVDALDMEMVVRASDFGAAVAFAALRGAADPIR